MQSQNLVELFKQHKPKKVFSRRWNKRSSVAIVLDHAAADKASVLLIKRAEHENDPWSGHMAFPGGRSESFDKNGLATAKREMNEEVGFDIDHPEQQTTYGGQLIGRLSDVRTTPRVIPRTMVVSPYVLTVSSQPELQPNYEVAETVWVPFSFFADINNRSIYELNFKGRTINMPCYRYEGKVIWGLTLSMIDEFVRLYGVDVPRWMRF